MTLGYPPTSLSRCDKKGWLEVPSLPPNHAVVRSRPEGGMIELLLKSSISVWISVPGNIEWASRKVRKLS